jgi:large subunit ribosomal protein L13
MNKKTFLPKINEIDRKWHLIDANGKVLGRLAVEVANLLRGKGKVIYTNHIDCGDFVVVTNAEKIVLTGNKLEQKQHFSYSGYPGGTSFTPYSVLMQKQPQKALMLAVKGMLADNKLAARQLKRLKVYRDANHKHDAQVHLENKEVMK